MALTHVFDPAEHADRVTDSSALRIQVAAAIAQLDAIIADASVTNAEAIGYLKGIAAIQIKIVRVLGRMVT